MANKINEIVDVLNNGETVEGLTARVDNLETDLEIFEEQTNDNITNLSDRIDTTDSRVNQISNYIENWEIVPDSELQSIITSGKLNTDIIVRIGNMSQQYSDYIEGEQFMLFPKGISVPSGQAYTFMFGGHFYSQESVEPKCYFSRVYLRGSDFTSVNAHYVNLHVVIYNFINNSWERQQMQFFRYEYTSNTPYIIFYKRVMNNE